MHNLFDYLSIPEIIAFIITISLAATVMLWSFWETLVSLKKLIIKVLYRILSRIDKHFFNKLYLYDYSSRETVAARKLVKGYFGENPEYPHPFYLIRHVTGYAHKGNFTIVIIADESNSVAGNNYFWMDRFQNYVIASSYFRYKKYASMHIMLKQSKYWPTSYESDDEQFYSGYAKDWQEAGDNITFE